MEPQDVVVTGNLAVLSNAIELIASVVVETAGNEVSNRLNGEPVALQSLSDAVAAKLQASLAAKGA